MSPCKWITYQSNVIISNDNYDDGDDANDDDGGGHAVDMMVGMMNRFGFNWDHRAFEVHILKSILKSIFFQPWFSFLPTISGYHVDYCDDDGDNYDDDDICSAMI